MIDAWAEMRNEVRVKVKPGFKEFTGFCYGTDTIVKSESRYIPCQRDRLYIYIYIYIYDTQIKQLAHCGLV